jgi:hypothetical protein
LPQHSLAPSAERWLRTLSVKVETFEPRLLRARFIGCIPAGLEDERLSGVSFGIELGSLSVVHILIPPETLVGAHLETRFFDQAPRRKRVKRRDPTILATANGHEAVWIRTLLLTI